MGDSLSLSPPVTATLHATHSQSQKQNQTNTNLEQNMRLQRNTNQASMEHSQNDSTDQVKLGLHTRHSAAKTILVHFRLKQVPLPYSVVENKRSLWQGRSDGSSRVKFTLQPDCVSVVCFDLTSKFEFTKQCQHIACVTKRTHKKCFQKSDSFVQKCFSCQKSAAKLMWHRKLSTGICTN